MSVLILLGYIIADTPGNIVVMCTLDEYAPPTHKHVP